MSNGQTATTTPWKLRYGLKYWTGSNWRYISEASKAPRGVQVVETRKKGATQQSESPKSPAPAESQSNHNEPAVGDVMNFPATPNGRMAFSLQVKSLNNDFAMLGRPDSQFGFKIPRQSLAQYCDDMMGVVRVPGRSEINEINDVIDGKAKLLGHGDDGMAFDAGDRIVKVSSVVPFHPDNNVGQRTPDQAIEMAKNQFDTAKEMYQAGVPGIIRQSIRQLGDKVFTVRDKVDIPEKFSPEQVDEVRSMMNALHRKGFSMNDDIQVGVGKDGKIYHFDTGKAAKIDHPDDDPDDSGRFERWAEKNGVDAAPLAAKAEKMLGTLQDNKDFVAEMESENSGFAKFYLKYAEEARKAMLANFPNDTNKINAEIDEYKRTISPNASDVAAKFRRSFEEAIRYGFKYRTKSGATRTVTAVEKLPKYVQKSGAYQETKPAAKSTAKPTSTTKTAASPLNLSAPAPAAPASPSLALPVPAPSTKRSTPSTTSTPKKPPARPTAPPAASASQPPASPHVVAVPSIPPRPRKVSPGVQRAKMIGELRKVKSPMTYDDVVRTLGGDPKAHRDPMHRAAVEQLQWSLDKGHVDEWVDANGKKFFVTLGTPPLAGTVRTPRKYATANRRLSLVAKLARQVGIAVKAAVRALGKTKTGKFLGFERDVAEALKFAFKYRTKGGSSRSVSTVEKLPKYVQKSGAYEETKGRAAAKAKASTPADSGTPKQPHQMTLAEMKKHATSIGMKGHSKLKKGDLLAAVTKHTAGNRQAEMMASEKPTSYVPTIEHSIPGEANTEIQVVKTPEGYSVSVLDKDADQRIVSRMYPLDRKEDAIRHADSMAGKKKTLATESAPAPSTLFPDADLSPREQAAAEAKKTDDQYAYARNSLIKNIGEDLKGSARHRANEWKGLQAAEANGSAEQMVNRNMLLKTEPHSLTATITPMTALSHLAAHMAISSIPDNPGKYPDNYEKYRYRDGRPVPPRTPPEKLREQYYEAYRDLKDVAEKAANLHPDPRMVLSAVHLKASELMGKFNRNDPMNPVSKGLESMIKSRLRVPQTRWDGDPKANSVLGRIGEFSNLLKEKYGSVINSETLEHAQKHAMDVIEGDSFNKSFGKESGGGGSGGVKRFDPSEAYVAHATREGGRMIDANTIEAGSRHMMNNVGLRGLQWGNYVSDDERQHHLTKSAEAFADLADAIGLPDSAISLGGKLGLAIGARGRAGAKAHYEPSTQVINLTRNKGVGSLAHEWGHALDHYLEGFEGGRFHSQRSLPSRTGEAMSQLRTAMHSSGFKQRMMNAVRDDIKAGKLPKNALDYWGKPEEMFARVFERHVQDKLHNEGRENTYLTGLSKTVHPFWPNRAESAKMAPAMEQLFSALKQDPKLNKGSKAE